MAIGESLASTPSWAVASITALLVTLSLLLESSLHFISHVVLPVLSPLPPRTRKRKALNQTVDQLKSGLRNMGFITLLLTVAKQPVSKICISRSLASSFLPCIDESPFNSSEALVVENTCSEGNEPLLSPNGTQQLQILIMMLAVFHLTCSLTTLGLREIKVCLLRQFAGSVSKADYFTLRRGFINYTFGRPSCFHKETKYFVISIGISVTVQFMCAYITLPLYALVSQMGSSMKETVFADQVVAGLKHWHTMAKRNLSTNETIISMPSSPVVKPSCSSSSSYTVLKKMPSSRAWFSSPSASPTLPSTRGIRRYSDQISSASSFEFPTERRELEEIQKVTEEMMKISRNGTAGEISFRMWWTQEVYEVLMVASVDPKTTTHDMEATFTHLLVKPIGRCDLVEEEKLAAGPNPVCAFLLIRLAKPRTTGNAEGSNPKVAARLYKPLITDDGRIYTCSGKHLFSFDSNGTVVWIIPLGYLSNAEISPVVDDRGKILNTEGQLYSLYMRTHHFRWVHDFSSIDKFMTSIPGNNGLLYVIFPRKASVIALDVYSGNILWQQSFGPLGTEQSLPVVDSNGWLSIGSLDGYLYSFSPTGEVKQLLKSTAIDSIIQTSPVLDCSGFAIYVLQTRVIAKSIRDIGNCTYISAMKPASLVLTMLTPATGTVYWTGNYPGTGNTLPCHTMSQINAWTCSQAKPKLVNMYTGNEGAILPFIFFQLAVLVLLAFFVRFCFVFWRKRKLQEHGLAMFLDKRRSLHHKRKTLGRMICKLEQREEEDTDAHENLDQLGEMVNIKKGIERKLSTSYSLGRDTVISQQGSILPLSDGKDRSHSLHSARKEDVTMFNTLSSSESGSSSDDSIDRESRQSWGETEQVDKGKAVVVGSSSSTSNLESENDSGEGSLVSSSSSMVCINPMFSKRWIDGLGSEGGQGGKCG
ncbi:Protein GAMETE EXPRESSED 3 [Dendrobium catenatum]|uniref:Protein GAMETE EXPRESSED 3 n=1 Tax=Dendrobium catenatum TaxID=906689 RepID=A0A2I0VFI8_9ASPA|nr:Protein GAMETE EXPRESSED 3 [Dendrobium catenatum]